MVHFPSENTQPGTATTVADILAAAADLIEPEGRWTQRNYGVPNVTEGYACLCLYGAICEAGRPIFEADLEAYEAIEDGAYEAVKAVVAENPIIWNDAPERTQAEVVAALRAAAEKARTPSTPNTGAGQ